MDEVAMPKTILAIPGRKVAVPRAFKRVLQVVLGSGLASLVALAAIMANGMLVGKGTALQAWNVWLMFVRRPDIEMTALLTSAMTVLVVYWMRDAEKSQATS